MGDGDRALRKLDGLKRGALGAVRHVDHQPDPVHLPDRLLAEPGDARVLGLVAAGREQALVVVGELHEARAELVHDLDQADFVLDRRAVLKAEDDRGLALGLRRAHVVGGAARHDQVAMVLEPAVPLLHVLHRLAELLVIADRDVHGGDAAGAHVAEDLRRPVAVLQAVYDDAVVSAHGGCPWVSIGFASNGVVAPFRAPHKRKDVGPLPVALKAFRPARAIARGRSG